MWLAAAVAIGVLLVMLTAVLSKNPSKQSPASAAPASAGAVPGSSSPAPIAQSPRPDPVSSVPPTPGDPLAGESLWVDPNSSAARQVAVWQSQGLTANATKLARIASQPIATWLTDSSPATMAKLATATSAAGATGSVPVLVVYDIPHRDCGGFSNGGEQSDQAYAQWIDAVARTIGNHRAVVVVEPDALATAVLGCGDVNQSDRYGLLRYAVHSLKTNSHSSVYLDAGNPGLVTNTTALASALQSSDISEADGFALNVSNFYPTAANVAYGRTVSAALGGGVHYIVDTSRNGNGRFAPPAGYSAPPWCNPPGRALGQIPTVGTAVPDLDAFLWVKRPGDSDGDCGLGDPPAGQWWPTYALGLATNQATNLATNQATN